MDGTETPVFSDKSIEPTEELIFSRIGDRKILWQKVMKYLADNHKDASGTWNYYNDGKQWLFKMVNKKKTVFWLSIPDDTFRVTFYFGDKAEPELIASSLPQKVKDDFLGGKHFGKIRGITIKVISQADVETIGKLTDIKIRQK